MAKNKVIYGKAIKYEVNCRPNNSVDIQCGGLVSISFDFYVDEKESIEKVIAFLREELKKNSLPLMSMVIKGYHRFAPKVWTKKDIAECIKNSKTV